jgi:hypothetical protein
MNVPIDGTPKKMEGVSNGVVNQGRCGSQRAYSPMHVAVVVSQPAIGRIIPISPSPPEYPAFSKVRQLVDSSLQTSLLHRYS